MLIYTCNFNLLDIARYYFSCFATPFFKKYETNLIKAAESVL